MAELEQVEKLREKANVTFSEAKEALDAAGGDILDALIYLEKEGKTTIPAYGGYYNSGGGPGEEGAAGKADGRRTKHNGETFWEMLKRFGKFCLKVIDKGNNNYLEAYKNGEFVFRIPVTVVVLLLLVCFWVVIPLFIISLFCGVRYSFRGAELGREAVNKVMESASEVVEDVKKTFTEGEGK